jgi:hypothetical protein
LREIQPWLVAGLTYIIKLTKESGG